jgi:hypothetical protein
MGRVVTGAISGEFWQNAKCLTSARTAVLHAQPINVISIIALVFRIAWADSRHNLTTDMHLMTVEASVMKPA